VALVTKLVATILGSGSSAGVPRLGGPNGAGDWGACDPANPKNRRRRCSLLVQRGGTNVLVDTSPDLREQLLSARIARIDGVLMTHPHADQTNGIDDLRPLTFLMKKRVDMYADRATLDHLKRQFAYCFHTPQGSEYPPIITGHEIPEPFRPFEIGGHGGAVPVFAFWQTHGPIRSLGYRFGPIGYSSDVSGLDAGAFRALEGVKVWIVDALRYTAHPTHANVATALEWIRQVGPERAVLTNLHHDLDYEALRAELPKDVEPAYDGMTIEVPFEE
jgi:phosphoribosyl 1,2-cyclic phosphate phosphodiesterase